MKRNIANYIFISELVLMLFTYQRSFSLGTARVSSADASAQFRKSCAVCHSTQRGETKIGPSLYGVLRKGSGQSEESIRKIIEEGKGNMPAFRQTLEPGQIADLIEYLKTL